MQKLPEMPPQRPGTTYSQCCAFESAVLGSFATDWHPKEYLSEFYDPKSILPDELEAIKFQVDLCKTLKGNPITLDFGAGPTAHRAIVVAPYVSEIHVADYLLENLAELQQWVYAAKNSHNWDRYIAYILQCEGIERPSDAQILQRANLARGKITRFIQADAAQRYPLGEEYHEYYSFVYSGFCADSATADKKTWTLYMRNIASTVAAEGTFFTAALRKTSHYKSGCHYFPSANVDENDLWDVLRHDFSPESMRIEVKEIPEMMVHGFSGIMLACAKKYPRSPALLA